MIWEPSNLNLDVVEDPYPLFIQKLNEYIYEGVEIIVVQILGSVEDVKNWLSQNQPLSHHK